MNELPLCVGFSYKLKRPANWQWFLLELHASPKPDGSVAGVRTEEATR